MAKETIFLAGDPLTFYQVVIRLSDGQFQVGAGTFEAFNAAHWTTGGTGYAQALTGTVLSSTHLAEYTRDFSAPAGIYRIAVFQQAGGSPAIAADGTPNVNYSRTIFWDGTKEVPPAVLFDGSYNVKANAQVAVVVTGTAVSSVAVPIGQDLAIYSGKWCQFSLSATGVDSSSWTQFYFSIKRDTEASDSEALVTIKLTNPGSGGDGLIILNGEAATTATDGALVASSVVTNTTIQVTLKNLATVIAPSPAGSSYIYELGRFEGSGRCEVLGTGALTVTRPVIRSTSAL